MSNKEISQWLMAAAAVLTVVLGFGAWRYFIIPPELRFPSTDAKWQVAPYIVLLLILAAQWLKSRPEKK